jgi:hypothetical protein
MSSLSKKNKTKKKNITGTYNRVGDSHFGFYSDGAEKLAYELLKGLAIDISLEKISRRRSIDKILFILEKVIKIDNFREDKTHIDKIIDFLSDSFKDAGFIDLTYDEFLEHKKTWEKNGKEINLYETTPSVVTKVFRIADDINNIIQQFEDMKTIKYQVSNEDPYLNPELNAGNDILIFKWKGFCDNTPLLGCALIGDGYASMLNDLIEKDFVSEDIIEKEYLGKRNDIDYNILIQVLCKLNALIIAYNHSIYNLPNIERLNVEFKNGKILTKWDGQDFTCELLKNEDWTLSQSVDLNFQNENKVLKEVFKDSEDTLDEPIEQMDVVNVKR